MSATVFANNMSIACKVASGKTTAAMPDVCLSPPSPPAGPIPIPYPNTASASDTDKGSTTVSIGGEPVMLKDQSIFKTSTGNEAATRNLGMGVVTHKITGEAQFVAWSMDVKFEGQNVPRHMDLMGHNEACVPSQTGPWPYIDSMDVATAEKCAKDIKKEQDACKNFSPNKPDGPSPCPAGGKPSAATVESYADKTAATNCVAARRCQLVPYTPTKNQAECCPGQTGHHLVEASSFFNVGRGGSRSTAVQGTDQYSQGKAPCVCAEGVNQYQGTHGLMHTFQSFAAKAKETVAKLLLEDGTTLETKVTTYGEARDQGVAASTKTFPESGCDEDCLKAQLDAYHNQCGINDSTQCKQVVTGYSDAKAYNDAEQAVVNRSARIVAERAGSATAAAF
jgi:hypothetical protein